MIMLQFSAKQTNSRSTWEEWGITFKRVIYKFKDLFSKLAYKTDRQPLSNLKILTNLMKILAKSEASNTWSKK